MYLADTLSRAYINSSQNNQEDFESVNMVQFLLIREERLSKLKHETKTDKTLQKLASIVADGWSEVKQLIPSELTPYYSFRDKISMQDSLLFKGERVIVPASLRPEMKQAVHSTHLGMEGCLKRARESLYWPGMNAEIRQFIESCETCQTFQHSQAKETLIPHEIPSRAWEKIGTDIFQFEDKYYLVTVDYLTNFFEIDRLDSITSHQVIRKLKAHFARYGIPCTVFSDNGTQFSSDSFAKFAKDWDFEHKTSSPHHPQSNGKAEAAVKIAKTMLKKNKNDQFLALLNIRNTPNHTGSSPAQAFLGRRTRTLMPSTPNLLKQTNTEHFKSKLRSKQEKVKSYFNKGAKDLTPLSEGDEVMLKPFGYAKRWSRGTVTKNLGQRSYEVTSNGSVYRRNRVHLRRVLRAAPDTPPSVPVPDEATATPHPVPEAVAAPFVAPSPDPPAGMPSAAFAPASAGAPGADVGLSPEQPHPEDPTPPVAERPHPESPAAPAAQKTPSPSKIPISRPRREIRTTKSKDFVYF